MPYLYLVFLIALADQGLKFVVQQNMYAMQTIDLLPGIVSLTYARNTGAAFSMFQSQTLLLVIVTLGVFVLIWLNRRHTNQYPRIFQIGLAVALGGALGNLIDRIRQGYVVDFVDFHFWPVFNLADAGILCGVCLLVLGMVQYDLKHKKTSSGTPPEEQEAVSKEEQL